MNLFDVNFISGTKGIWDYKTNNRCRHFQGSRNGISLNTFIEISSMRFSYFGNQVFWPAWNTNMVSACCLPVTEGHNWHIDYLSVILFCHGQAG